MAGRASQDHAWAYLSVADWPEGWSVDQRLRSVVTASGLEPFFVSQRVVKPAPQVIQRMDAFDAAAAVDALRRDGVMAFAPTEVDLRAAGDAMLVRDVSWLPGGMELRLLRPDITTQLTWANLLLIVHGQIRLKTKPAFDVSSPGWTPESTPGSFSKPIGRLGWNSRFRPLAGAAFDIADAASEADRGTSAGPRVRTDCRHLIDFHTKDGQRFRIDASKFSWQILGEQRGVSDAPNTGVLLELLSEKATGVVIDRQFDRFSCPKATVERLFPHGPVGSVHDPIFEFYSRWASLMYRGLTSN